MFGKIPNEEILGMIAEHTSDDDDFVIEMIASYGMPVGREVFDTVVWIGRFVQFITDQGMSQPTFVYRRDEKMTICHSPKANDATIRQALIDMFAYGTPNKGKGTKKSPGWFYGFRADVWQAYAVAVTYRMKEKWKGETE